MLQLQRVWTLRQRLPATKENMKRTRSPGVKDKFKFKDKDKWMLWKLCKEVQEKMKVKLRRDHLISNNRSLQQRVNNLKVDQKKTAYARFKVKQRNISGLALIDTGNLVHPLIVSAEF